MNHQHDRTKNTNISTEGGAVVQGDVNTGGGDFVGRDKIVQTVNQVIQQAISATEEARQAQDLAHQRLAEGVRTYAQRLAAIAADSTDTDKAGPYKGLFSYTLADAEVFFGRDKAIVNLLAQMERHRLTVLQAESGAGKSSLLHAGIAPRLLAAGHLPVILSPNKRPPDWVIKQTFLPDLAQTPTLRDAPLRAFLRPVTEMLESQTTLVLILDQFEEFFTLLPDETVRTHFVEELADCLEDESLPVRWVLALRSEFFGDLAAFRPRIRNPFQNDFRLNRLTQDEAREVIVKPAQRYGIRYAAALVTRLLEHLSEDGEVYPPQLQLVCLALYQTLTKLQQDGSNQPQMITEQMYAEAGEAAGILRGHLNQVLHDSLPTRQERDLARRLLVALVSADQRRIRRTRSDLAATLASGIVTAQMLDGVLDELVLNRLLNVEVDEESDDHSYEIAHDYLLAEVRVDPEVQAQKAAQELLNQEVDAYTRYSTLLDRDKYEIINSQRSFLRLDERAEELLAKSQDTLDQAEAEKEAQRQHELEQAQKLAEEQRLRAEEGEQAARGLLKRLVAASMAVVIAVIAFSTAAWLGVDVNNQRSTAQVALVTATVAQGQAKIEAENAVTAAAVATVAQGKAEIAAATARAAEATAEANASEAKSRELAAQANATIARHEDPDLGLLLALEAAKISFEGQTSSILDTDMILKRALVSAPITTIRPSIQQEDALQLTQEDALRLTMDDSGRYLSVLTPPSSLRVHDARNGRLLWSVDAGSEILNTALVSTSSSLNAILKNGEVREWDMATGQELRRWRTPATDFYNASVALSPKGTHIAVEVEDEQTVLLIDASTQEIVQTVQSEVLVQNVTFSPDGALLVFVGALPGDITSSRIYIVDVAGGSEKVIPIDGYAVSAQFGVDADSLFVELLIPEDLLMIKAREARVIYFIQQSDGFWDPLGFSPDGMLMTTGSTISDTVALRDVTTGHIVNEFEGSFLAFHPDGEQILMTGAGDSYSDQLSDLRLINITKGTTQNFTNYGEGISWASYMPDGQQVWLSSFSGTLRLWDVSQNRLANRAVELPSPAPVAKILFNTAGNHALTVDKDSDRVRLWNLDSMDAMSVAISLTTTSSEDIAGWNDLFAIPMESGIDVLDASTGIVLHRIPALYDTCRLLFSPDGRQLLLIDREKGIVLWDLTTQQHTTVEYTMPGFSCFSEKAEFSPHGEYLALSDWRTGAYLIDTTDGQIRYSRTGRGSRQAGFTADGKYLIITWDVEAKAIDAERKGEILVVETATGKTVANWSLLRSPSGVHHLASSRDVTAVSLGGTLVYLVATPSGALVGKIDAQDYVSDLGFDRIGSTLAVLVSSGTQIWDLSNPEDPVMTALVESGNLIGDITFQSWNEDIFYEPQGKIDIWGNDQLEVVAQASVVTEPNEGIRFVRLTADRERMATLDKNGIVRIWPTDFHELIQLACQVVSRELTEQEWSRYMGSERNPRPTCRGIMSAN